MQLNKKYVFVALALQTLMTGCASITKDANQPVKVETYSKDNQVVLGAKCTAKNERGEWKAETPSAMSIRRSGDNLLISCEKEGHDAGLATVISRANGGMFGNILFGGGIGAIIDHNKGTAYSYPDWIRVIMGDNLVFDRKNNKDNEVMLGQAASPEELKKIEEAKVAEEKVAQEKALAEDKLAEQKAAEAEATK
ncbi:MAG TPA: hypothetical protein PL131_11380 [Methylotenera sp.]|nr:hypothetical protein [Methylotenera sp.]HPH06467.1 hypothetical protein [Methylotenera sp.]HPN01228.1 hypothetical protein [Methylotenera sp.]